MDTMQTQQTIESMELTRKEKETIIMTRVDKLVAAANRAEIINRETSEMGADLAKIFRSVARKIEAMRVELVNPLNEDVKKINLRYKNWLQVLKDGQNIIDSKVARYKLAEQASIVATQKIAEDKGLNDYVVITENEVTRGQLASASLTEVWDYEITDESIVPREYCVPSAAKLRSAVNHGIRQMNGIRIYQKQKLNVR